MAQEIEYVTMDPICARLGDGIHHCTAEFSVLRVEAVGDKPKLFDRIKVGNQSSAHVASLANNTHVHQKRVRCFALAIHRNITRIVEVTGYRPCAGSGAATDSH